MQVIGTTEAVPFQNVDLFSASLGVAVLTARTQLLESGKQGRTDDHSDESNAQQKIEHAALLKMTQQRWRTHSASESHNAETS